MSRRRLAELRLSADRSSGPVPVAGLSPSKRPRRPCPSRSPSSRSVIFYIMLKSATSLLARSTVQRTARRIVTSSGRASSTSTSSSSAATEGFSRRLGTVRLSSCCTFDVCPDALARLQILVTASSSVVLALYLDSQRQTVQLDEASTPSKRPMRRSELISMDEVSQHNKEGDLWVVMNGDVWDLTEVSSLPPLPSLVLAQLCPLASDSRRPFSTPSVLRSSSRRSHPSSQSRRPRRIQHLQPLASSRDPRIRAVQRLALLLRTRRSRRPLDDQVCRST